MTNQDIIAMARGAGFETMLRKGRILGFDRDGDYTEELERFAALVAAASASVEREQGQKWIDAVTAQHKQEILAEREACAKVCDRVGYHHEVQQGAELAFDLAAAIRARGETK